MVESKTELKQPCGYLTAAAWAVGIATTIGLAVVMMSCGQVRACEDRVNRNASAIVGIERDIKYIREALTDIRNAVRKP